jgi:hypothetical protein
LYPGIRASHLPLNYTKTPNRKAAGTQLDAEFLRNPENISKECLCFNCVIAEKEILLFLLYGQENHDVLIKCLTEDKRFDETRPVAACVVYKSLLQWRSFEAEKTTIFDRIIHTIRSSIEVESLTNGTTLSRYKEIKILSVLHHILRNVVILIFYIVLL